MIAHKSVFTYDVVLFDNSFAFEKTTVFRFHKSFCICTQKKIGRTCLFYYCGSIALHSRELSYHEDYVP